MSLRPVLALLLATGVVACRGEPERREVPPANPSAAAPEAVPRVDPRVWAQLATRSRQRVIVSVADPRGEAEQPGGPEAAPLSRRIAQRRADLAATKDTVRRRLTRDVRPPSIRYTYPAFRVMALEVDATELTALETIPEVTRIFADVAEEAQLDRSLDYVRAPWFHQNLSGGEGVTIAILDTPVRYQRPDFGSCSYVGAPGCSVVEWLSFADESAAEVIAAEDSYGKSSHGTNVAAIALGVAPDAGLLGLNVFHPVPADETVRTFPSDQIQALEWVADNAVAYNIAAVNMSIGATRDDPMPCNHDDPRYDPIRTLRSDYDILTAISSGNSGEPNAIKAPGCLSMGVTVAAQFDTDLGDYPKSCAQPSPHVGEMACFSNLSGMLDLVAPGVNVEAGGEILSGTSMASPHVAGAIAAWQSYFLALDGQLKNGPWMHRRLMADGTVPMVHGDGRRFAQLRLDDPSFDWEYAHAFSGWHREASNNRIGSAGTGFERTLEVTGQGFDVAGVYLYLEVVHLEPEDLDVRLESPSGASATVSLPGGQAHFHGVVGRVVSPGAFDALAGSPVDGTWTLSLRDTVAADRGNYLQAALFFVEEGCSPDCRDAGCGDDLCGGDCGALCTVEGSCLLEGSSAPDEACLGCVPALSTTALEPLEGPCDDGDPCTVGDACEAGACGAGVPRLCPDPGPCQGPATCDSATGECVYAPKPDGLACDPGDGCALEGICEAGTCVAEPRVCIAPLECWIAGPCVEGECVYAPAPDGTPCSSGICGGGVCGEEEGCGCEVVGAPRPRGGWLLLAGFGIATGRRRRRSRRPHRR